MPATDRVQSVLGLPPLLALAADRGLDREALLRAIPIAPTLLRDPRATVPVRGLHALVRRLLASTGDPALGLEAARYYHAESFGLLGAVIRLAPSVRQVVRLFLDHLDLTFTFFVLDYSESADQRGHVVLLDDALDLGPLRRFYLDRDLGFICSIARELWPDTYKTLLQAVAFDYPEPPEAARYRDFFPCPVRFGAEHPSVILDLSRDAPRADANALGLALVEEHLRAFAGRRQADERLTERVRREITLSIARRQRLPELDAIAAGLGISDRALRRRLAAEGTSFRALTDEVMARVAKKYLRDSALSVGEVAVRVGYAEPASFVRAFQRVVGTTPESFRERQQQ